MASLDSINVVVSAIMTDAAKKIGEALIERAAVIDTMFDDAYGSCVEGNYASGMECVASGLRFLDELLDYAENVMDTADAPSWEFVRDALGTVQVERAPIQKDIVDEYNKRIKRYASPTFGDNAKLYIVHFKDGRCEEYRNSYIAHSLAEDGIADKVELYTLGAGYFWNKKLHRWVLDALINPHCRPDLKEYM